MFSIRELEQAKSKISPVIDHGPYSLKVHRRRQVWQAMRTEVSGVHCDGRQVGGCGTGGIRSWQEEV